MDPHELGYIFSRYKNIPEVEILSVHGIAREDWDDTMLCGKDKGVGVYTLLDKDVVELGSVALRAIMQSAMSEENIGAIILLAWNLRNPEDLTRPIFPNHSPCASPEDVDIHTLSKQKRTASTGNVGSLSFPISASEAAASITYVCASLLRLFTKPAENYLKALHQIKSNFSNFYHFKFPLTWYHPPKASLEDILRSFRNDSIFKYGIAGMLYLHNEIQVAKGLRAILYEQHLSCAGMHAYTLFVSVQSALEVPAEELIKMLNCRPLNCRMTSKALKTLAEIIRKYDGDNIPENEKRMTWKYARIFDPQFFQSIQTKNCTELVYMLAYLSNLAGVQGDSVLGIVQLAGLSEILKQPIRVHAQKIFDEISASKKSKNLTSDPNSEH